MSVEESMPWSGPDFLARVGGTAAEFSPARVLFLAHRLGASGRLWLTQAADIRTLDMADGAVVGCSGFPDLLLNLGVEGERGDALSDLLELATAKGVDRATALEAGAKKLGAFIVSCEGDADLMVQFAVNAPGPAIPVPMPVTPVGLVTLGIQNSAFLTETRGWRMVEGAEAPHVAPPADSARESWGLSDASLTLIDAASAASSLGAIEIADDVGWEALATLRLLGIVGTASAVVPEPSVPAAQEAAAPPAPQPEPERSSTKPRQEASKANAGKRFDRPHDKTGETRTGRRRRRGGKVNLTEILGRNPWESPPDKVEAHLKSAYDALGASRPEAALGIAKAEELEVEVIEQRYRDACARYHPDRYLGSQQAVRALAEGCFSRVSDAYHRLKDPTLVEQARDRLIFRETGKRPVNDKTRARSRVDFKRAEMLFRQRRYEEAAKSAKRAEEGDPSRWEYRYLYLRSAWHGGLEDTRTTVDALLALEGMSSQEKGEATYIAGEMLLKDGKKTEAQRLFKQAVETDPENVGARRRIRLEVSRKAKESGKAKDGRKNPDGKKGGRPLFGGLFGRRGD